MRPGVPPDMRVGLSALGAADRVVVVGVLPEPVGDQRLVRPQAEPGPVTAPPSRCAASLVIQVATTSPAATEEENPEPSHLLATTGPTRRARNR